MNSRLVTTLAGLSLVVPAWIGILSSGVPTLYGPSPTLTILPALLLSERHQRAGYLALLVPSILFFLWDFGLFRGQANLPRRTIALLMVSSALTPAYFVLEWHYGAQYQGSRYTSAICVINVIWLISLYSAAFWTLRKPSFKANLFLHWLLFVWLAWYAFPYLGELP